MRGTQSRGAARDAIQMRFDPGPTRGICGFIISRCIASRVFLSPTQRYLLNLNKQISSRFFLLSQKTLPLMSAEIRLSSQICGSVLVKFDLQSGSLQSKICKIPQLKNLSTWVVGLISIDVTMMSNESHNNFLCAAAHMQELSCVTSRPHPKCPSTLISLWKAVQQVCQHQNTSCWQ